MNNTARYKLVIGLLLLFVCPFSMDAQHLGATGEINRSEMLVGEQATIDLVVRTTDIAATRIIIPEDTLWQNFELLSYHPLDTVAIDGGLYELSAQMVITAWDSCLLTVPEIRIVCNGESASVGPFYIKVSEPTVDVSRPDSIAEIKGLWPVKLTLSDYLSIILRHPLSYILLVALLSLLLYYLWRKWRTHRLASRSNLDAPLELTCYERSKQELRLLLDSVDVMSPKQYYTTLLDILRIYLTTVTDIPALEMLPEELRQAVGGTFDIDTHPLAAVLAEASLAKYAKGVSSSTQMRKAVPPIEELIDRVNEILQASESNEICNTVAGEEENL